MNNTPIEKIKLEAEEGFIKSPVSALEVAMKLNELIDIINAMREVPNVYSDSIGKIEYSEHMSVVSPEIFK